MTKDAFVLQQIPLFMALPPEEMGFLSQKLRLGEFPPGAILFSENELGDRFSIVLEGEVEVVKALGTPDERILAVLGPGEFIGEMSLLYRDRLRSASARTRTSVQALEMTQADFDALLRRQPVLAFRIMQEMSLRLRNSENATIRDLQEKNRELAQAYMELKAAQVQLVEKEKMEHELRMARRIQESILPDSLPELAGWQIAAHWQPARAVSGDFYDFIQLSEDEIAIIIGDVTDKGVPAALVMATTRSILRATSRQIHSPAEILKEVNDLLCPDIPPNMFVTCFYGVLNPSTGAFRYANAGHDLPYRRVAQGGIEEMRATGMPLGLMPEMRYEDKFTQILPGECLLMYSDGLVEAHNAQNEMFSFPRLRQLLSEGFNQADPIQFLLDQLADFTGPDWEQEDDVTLVTISRQNYSPHS